MRWQLLAKAAPVPEGELHATTQTTADGRMGERIIAKRIGEAMANGMGRPDYASIRVPVLAFVAFPRPVEDQLQNYVIRDDEDRNTLAAIYAADETYIKVFTDQLVNSVPSARVVRMIGADHYIFISNEAEVLLEIRTFTTRL